MSLLDQSSSLYEIKLYYKYLDVGGNKKLVILDDEKAKILTEEEIKKKNIDILITKWANLTWKEQNDVSQLSTKVSLETGQREFNFTLYRDGVVKKCLKEWNIEVGGKAVPVSAAAIDMLPGEVILRLYQVFEKILDYSEGDLGN